MTAAPGGPGGADAASGAAAGPAPVSAPVRVAIVDDQAMVRTGFRLILDAEPDIEVVAEAGDGREALDAVARSRPDVVLMDIQMPVLDGLEATRRIVAAGDRARVVILTTFERDDYITEAVRAGASGFLIKNAPPEDLLTAVRVVAAGEALLSPSVTRRVLALVAGGLSNGEIAERLYLGEATVKTHLSRVLSKLGLRDRVQAAVYAYESGLTRPGSAPPTDA